MPAKPFSPALDDVVKRLAKLPGIGKKAAMRMAVYLLEAPTGEIEELADSIRSVKKRIGVCSVCGNWTEVDPCHICTSGSRDRSRICVIETPADLLAVEASGYRGIYHVLGGVLSPLEEIGPSQLRIRELTARVHQEPISELILALNPTAEGEATSLYLARLFEPLQIPVSRIAYGIPVGSDLRLADEATLSHAIHGRRNITG